MRHFQIFDKIDSFLENVSNVLENKEATLRLWRTTWFIAAFNLKQFLIYNIILG